MTVPHKDQTIQEYADAWSVDDERFEPDRAPDFFADCNYLERLLQSQFDCFPEDYGDRAEHFADLRATMGHTVERTGPSVS